MKKSFGLFALTLLFCSNSFASHPAAGATAPSKPPEKKGIIGKIFHPIQGEIVPSSQREITSEEASKVSVKENELKNQGGN